MSISTPGGRISEPETESTSAPHMDSSHESVQEDQPYSVKGKRTKRYRLQAAIPITVNPKIIVATDFSPKSDETSTSSDIYGNKQEPNTTNNKRSIMIKAKKTINDIGQPASSSEEHNRHHHSTTITVENQDDEDMANCLILLAQGQSKRFSQIPPPRIIGQKRTDFDNIYECKTCGKRFPSFQALGGHRCKPQEAQERRPVQRRDQATQTLSALGGHMRRHRGAIGMPISLPATKALSLIPLTVIPPLDYSHHDCYFPDHDDLDRSSGLSLDLDLNLPAVSVEEHNESQFQCASKQQQQPKNTIATVKNQVSNLQCKFDAEEQTVTDEEYCGKPNANHYRGFYQDRKGCSSAECKRSYSSDRMQSRSQRY
ncbi:Zinc finger protein ZAT5-like protein [Drosera capensis]